MVRADVIDLIAESQPRGVFDTTGVTTRQVFCTIRSVTQSEVYAALSEGLKPEVVFVLSDYAEYGGEKKCKHGTDVYRIIRTYVSDTSIELVCEKEGVVDAP